MRKAIALSAACGTCGEMRTLYRNTFGPIAQCGPCLRKFDGFERTVISELRYPHWNRDVRIGFELALKWYRNWRKRG